ncbi:MAG: FUSC family protein [Algibacter sp.]
MKKIFTILAIITSVLAIILSVLPISNLAVFPAIAALIFGIVAFYLSKKTGKVKKIVQFAFLLTIASLSIITYKAIFNKTEVGDTQEMVEKETESQEDAIEELEGLDIEIE